MIARLLALLFAVCLTSAAEAQIFWSMPGSACVPDETTANFQRHKVGNASVQHATGNVDRIVLTCPIQPFSSVDPSWVLQITYRDSTGTATAAFVRARLYRMEIGTATPELLATVNSNSSAVTTLKTIVSPTLPHTFNFDTHLYWVYVELDRSATGQTVIFYYALLAVV
jgi:hypothetical protein